MAKEFVDMHLELKESYANGVEVQEVVSRPSRLYLYNWRGRSHDPEVAS